jgi:Acetyltransferase (GNAT) domain
MSTNSSALFPARKGLGARENLCPELCSSRYLPAAQGKVSLKAQSGSSFFLSVRPLSVVTDLPVIYSWMCSQYAVTMPAGLSLPELDEAYSSVLASDFAQPFIALINDLPICQVDVYKTKLDAISLSYEARQGDYGLHLLYDAQTDQDRLNQLLRACTGYFLSFPEVGRMVIDIETDNKWMNKLVRNMGFRWRKKIKLPYKTSNLYIGTRRTFAALPA